MVEPTSDLDLALVAIERGKVASQRHLRDFEHDVATALRINRSVHLGKPATSEHGADFVPIVNAVAWGESHSESTTVAA